MPWPHDDAWTRRLWAAVVIARRVEVCEALLAGVPVPATRLDRRWHQKLKLREDVVLDEAFVLAVNGIGPLEEEKRRGR